MKTDFFHSTDEAGLRFLAGEYLRYGKHRGLSIYTTQEYKKTLRRFIRWCEERGITKAEEVGRPVLEGYLRYLSLKTAKNKNTPIGFRTRFNRISKVKYFFNWLYKKRYLAYNPAEDIAMPKNQPPKLREILSVAEIERILSQADIGTALGLRDRAMMELFYGTGIRRRELFDLDLPDLDFEAGTLKIKGKSGKQRLAPLGDRAAFWLKRYLSEARPRLSRRNHGENRHGNALFVSARGRRISLEHIGKRVRFYFKEAGLDGKGACHLFRHSMATLMLKNGADIRVVQEILGHDRLNTTQIYTHLNIGHLIRVYRKTHPAAKRIKKKTGKNA